MKLGGNHWWTGCSNVSIICASRSKGQAVRGQGASTGRSVPVVCSRHACAHVEECIPAAGDLPHTCVCSVQSSAAACPALVAQCLQRSMHMGEGMLGCHCSAM